MRVFPGVPRVYGSALVVLAAGAGPALAGEAPASASPGAEPGIEAEIVVTAPRSEGPLQVVTDPGQARQPAPANDGAEYLKSIPGFSVTRKGGIDADPLFRGMAGSRIDVLSSEAMLLGGCGARMDPPTAYVFPQNYDRLMVLKGPQSVLWGTGGSAATVIFERDPYDHLADADRVDASVLGGSWNRRDLATDLLAGNEHGYLRLQGSDARADDYQDGNGDQVHSEYHRWNAQAILGWTPADDTLVELSGAASDGEAAYADRLMDGVAFDREALTLRAVRSDVSDTIRELEAQVAYSYVDHVMDNFTLRDFVPSMMMPSPAASNPDRRTLAARLSASLTLGDRLNADVGLDAHDDEHRLRRTMNAARRPLETLARRTDARYQQQGVFAELSYQLAPGRLVKSGLRLDRWKVEDERALIPLGMMTTANPTAGAEDTTWLTSGFLRYEHGLAADPAEPDTDVVLFAGLGYAERTADYWERFGNGNQSESTLSAFYTDPERTTQLDLGLLRRTTRSHLSVSVFASQVADYILMDTTMPGKPTGTLVTRNVDARTWGGEVEYSQRLAERWMWQSSLAYTRGTNRTDGAPLAQLPPLEGRLSLTWATDRFSLGGLVRLVAEQNRVDVGRGNIAGQDIGPTDAFAVLSTNGSYRISDAVNLSAGIDNLLDEAYAEHLSRAGAAVSGFVQDERVNEPGRTLWVELDLTL